MITIQTHTLELAGASYDIGCQMGKMTGEIPPLKAMHTNGMEGFGAEQVKEAAAMFDRPHRRTGRVCRYAERIA